MHSLLPLGTRYSFAVHRSPWASTSKIPFSIHFLMETLLCSSWDTLGRSTTYLNHLSSIIPAPNSNQQNHPTRPTWIPNLSFQACVSLVLGWRSLPVFWVLQHQLFALQKTIISPPVSIGYWMASPILNAKWQHSSFGEIYPSYDKSFSYSWEVLEAEGQLLL